MRRLFRCKGPSDSGPADILLIVEVAESSIDYDSEVKAGLYATAGVREYWLVDLTTGTVTRASAPSGGAYINAISSTAQASRSPRTHYHYAASQLKRYWRATNRVPQTGCLKVPKGWCAPAYRTQH